VSHTSQRRGLDPERPGREVIVVAMIPGEYTDKSGIRSAMRELALKMLAHNPHDWLSRNYTDLAIPQLRRVHGAFEWLHEHWPEASERLLLAIVAARTPAITALYTDMQDVVDLIDDLNGGWLQNNRENGYPISIVLSGLFDDVHRCCQRTGSQPHTYLHSLGFFGKTEGLPSGDELEIITMCGHGMIAANRVRWLLEGVRDGDTTPAEAAENVARPCLCGVVNRERAEEVFRRLAEAS
jgi:hypothetical protein